MSPQELELVDLVAGIAGADDDLAARRQSTTVESSPGRLCPHGGGRWNRHNEPEPPALLPLPLLLPSAARGLAGAAASTAARGQSPYLFGM